MERSALHRKLKCWDRLVAGQSMSRIAYVNGRYVPMGHARSMSKTAVSIFRWRHEVCEDSACRRAAAPGTACLFTKELVSPTDTTALGVVLREVVRRNRVRGIADRQLRACRAARSCVSPAGTSTRHHRTQS